MEKYYVYIHRRKDTNEVFYVGISKQIKYRRIRRVHGRNGFWKNIAKKHGYKAEVIHDNLSKEQACLIEIALIKSYGRLDLETGVLANLTQGGDGSVDCKRTEEQKKKISESRKGKKRSEETKLKIKQTMTGQKRTPETKHLLAVLAKNRFSKRIVNTETKVSYNSINEAAEAFKMRREVLSRQLTGLTKKTTPLEYENT